MPTTLLLADDSPTIAKILQMALANETYQIRSVLTAEEALRELKEHTPYFFLCDLNLPGKSGYEFARMIRADSKLRDVRVVLLASAFEPVDEAEFATCGADGLVKKPFDPAELRTKLRQIMEAPPKFPGNARVSGSLSGFMVQDPQDSTRTNLTIGGISTAGMTDTNPSLVAPPKDDASLLLQTNEAPPASDADSILAGLVSPPSEEPPAFLIPTAPAGSLPDDNRPEPTVTLDLSEAGLGGLSNSQDPSTMSFDTPPGGTQIIELGTHTVTVAQTDLPPMKPPMKAAPSEQPPPPPAAPAPADDEPLSANAQALAAFFDAEIHTNAGQREANTAPGDAVPAADAFDASLDSIDWNSPSPATADLKDWSSNKAPASTPAPPPKAAPAPAKPAPKAEDAPPPFSRPAAPAPKTEAPRAAAASPAPAPAPKREEPARPAIRGSSGDSGHLMFDTGGSTFRFSEDYVHRITKSFTGEPNETVPESHPATAAMFPQASDDRAGARVASDAGSAGGGAWNEQEVAKIEQIVREEVQMVVREVAEKIAWEVIPELAENLIKKELERVLKEMGQ